MHMASDPNIWGNRGSGGRGNEIESGTEQIAPLPSFLHPHLALALLACPRPRPVVPQAAANSSPISRRQLLLPPSHACRKTEGLHWASTPSCLGSAIAFLWPMG